MWRHNGRCKAQLHYLEQWLALQSPSGGPEPKVSSHHGMWHATPPSYHALERPILACISYDYCCDICNILQYAATAVCNMQSRCCIQDLLFRHGPAHPTAPCGACTHTPCPKMPLPIVGACCLPLYCPPLPLQGPPRAPAARWMRRQRMHGPDTS